jgi:peptide/nickel transport system permease protein
MSLPRIVPASGKVRAGLIIVIAFALLAIFGPLIYSQDPQASGPDTLQGPSRSHWFGTTRLGQDVFSQFLHGARVSMMVGLVAGVLSQAVSVLIGLVAGYFRGLIDDLLYILTAVFLVIPGLPLLVVLTGYIPGRGLFAIALVIAVTSWAPAARVLRAQTMSLRSRDFVEAARASGESWVRIVFAEIMPNALPVVASGFIGSTLAAILAEAGLSFLGIGSLTSISWGSMLYFSQNAQAMLIGAWWWFVPPGLAIALLGAGLTLINFGIDEYANPRLRTSHSRAKRTRQVSKPQQDSTEVPISSPRDIDGQSRDSESAVGEEAPSALASTVPDAPPAMHPVSFPLPPAISVEDLVVDYATSEGTVRAVDQVSLTLHRGEFLGLAGESGSGKSTLTNAVARLLRPPAEIPEGAVTYHRQSADRKGGNDRDIDLLNLEDNSLRALRWSEIAIVFQSAMNALNPVTRISTQFDDVIRHHRPDLTSSRRRELAQSMLERVGIPGDRISSYPHELSGGMKQRVAIAIALVLDPEVIIMDEPTTALDLLVQRDVINQVMQLREEFGFAVIFTTHDLSILLEMADTIAVMRQGRLVEYGSALDVYTHPGHPYTRALLDSLSELGAQL